MVNNVIKHTDIAGMLGSKPVILVNHLLEPPSRLSGITRYLFSLLAEMGTDDAFQYVLLTAWPKEDLPTALRTSKVDYVWAPYVTSTPLNILAQMRRLPGMMQRTGAVLEFNCNPIGAFWPQWPRVITVHDLYFELRPQDYRWRHRLWWHLFFPRALGAATRVICVSETTRRHLEQTHPTTAHKAVVIHEASAMSRTQVADNVKPCARAKHEKSYGIYVGNISPNKNPAVLAQALRILEDSGQAPEIHHVGRDELGLLERAQHAAGLRRPIHTLGTISDEKFADAYRHAQFFVNTSIDEGFCLPILEAQEAGLPVICSDIPVLREVAGDGALFFNVNDPKELARRITELSHGPASCRLIERGRGNAARFSWRRAAEETQLLFHRILTDRDETL